MTTFVNSLEPEDRFELIPFNIQASPLFSQPSTVDATSKEKATEHLKSQRAMGGTVLRPAVEAAYRYRDADRRLNVVVLSDGMTEQKEHRELLALIKQRPENTSVFCVGVSNEVNRPRSRRAFLTITAGSALAVSATVWFLTSLATCRGLSGIDSALFVLLAAWYLIDFLRSGSFRQAIIPVSMLAGFLAKISYEIVTGHTYFVDSATAAFRAAAAGASRRGRGSHHLADRVAMERHVSPRCFEPHRVVHHGRMIDVSIHYKTTICQCYSGRHWLWPAVVVLRDRRRP